MMNQKKTTAENLKYIDKSRLDRRIDRIMQSSEIYELIGLGHLKEWAVFKRQFSHIKNKKMRKFEITFFNECFENVQVHTRKFFTDQKISKSISKTSESCLGLRLSKNSIYDDLLKVDSLSLTNSPVDLKPLFVDLNSIKSQKDLMLLRSSAHHLFLHRPQKTKIWFLHELIVGFLLNGMEHREKALDLREINILKPEHSPISAYIIIYLAETLQMSTQELVSLHFSEVEIALEKLPLPVVDLMLIANHIYWFLEFYAKTSKKERTVTEMLLLVNLYFVIPSMEKYNKNKNLRLKSNALLTIDESFRKDVLMANQASRFTSDLGIARKLILMAEEVWH